MPHKYILVNQIYAKIPFKQCDLHYMIKIRSSGQQIHTKKQFIGKSIVNKNRQYLDFEYDDQYVYSLALYVLAIDHQEVVSIGYVPLNLDQELKDKKQYLKGIVEQNGYVIISIRDQPFHEKAKDLSIARDQVTQKNICRQVSKRSNKLQDEKILQQSSQKKNDFESPVNELRQMNKFDSRVTENEKSNNKALSVKSQPLQIFNSLNNSVDKKESKLHSLKPADHEIQDSSSGNKSRFIQVQVFIEQKQYLLSHKLQNINHQEHFLQRQKVHEQQKQKLKNLGIQL